MDKIIKAVLVLFLLFFAGCKKEVSLVPEKTKLESLDVDGRELMVSQQTKSMVLLDVAMNKSNEIIFNIICANTMKEKINVDVNQISVIGQDSVFVQEKLPVLTSEPAFEKGQNQGLEKLDAMLAEKNALIPDGRIYLFVKVKYKEYKRFILTIPIGDDVHIFNIISE